MKKVTLAIVFLAASSGASAESDVTATFSIIGGLQFWDGGEYETLNLDLNFGTNTLTANGTMVSPAGLSSPATGTCFFTAVGGVYCNLQVDHLSMNIILGSDLNGTIEAKGANAVIIDTAPLQVYRG